MKSRKLVSLAVIIMAAVLLFSSCGTDIPDDGTAEAETIVQSEAASGAADGSETEAIPDMSDVNLKDTTFSVLYRNGAGSYDVNDVYAEGLNTEPVNDAVYTRNRMLEDDLKITFKAVASQSPIGMIRKTGFVGDDEFDLITDEMNQMFSQTLSGYYYNWRKLSHYVPEDPWWDSNADEALSIGNVVFLAVSDASMKAASNARFLYINKHICDLYGMTVPYDSVKNGTWTMDAFIAMVQTVSEDLNGDGVMDGHDRYGLLSETSTFFISGCDVPFTTKDEDGNLTVSFVSERTSNIIDKVADLMSDKTHLLSFAAAAKGQDTTGYKHIFEFGRSLFADDHFLFVQNGADDSDCFVDMKSEYGILPNPKYDVYQESYWHLVDPYTCAWAMPSTVEDPEKVAAIMAYWSYLSSNTVVDAFYEITLRYKRLNSEEDSEMLDLIRKTMRYEISTLDDIGVSSVITSVSKGSGLASAYQKKKNYIERMLKDVSKRYAKYDT